MSYRIEQHNSLKGPYTSPAQPDLLPFASRTCGRWASNDKTERSEHFEPNGSGAIEEHNMSLTGR
jgi:hypothetical protein